MYMKKWIATLMAACLMLALVPAASAMDAVRFGPFDAEDLNGEENVTEKIFESAKITLVNFWTTWCGPCISELPELEQLSELSGGDVQVVSVLLDGSFRGERDEAAIEAMYTLAEENGITYPVLLADTFLDTIGTMVRAVPTTFIIDEKGILHDRLEGSRSADQWLEAAQTVADSVYDDGITLKK